MSWWKKLFGGTGETQKSALPQSTADQTGTTKSAPGNEKVAMFEFDTEREMQSAYALLKNEITASTFAGAQIRMRTTGHQYCIVCLPGEFFLLSGCFSYRGVKCKSARVC